MALSKDKKNQVINDVAKLLADSKLTVVAQYQGTSVKAMQQLRRDAGANNTSVRVVKNRLFKKVLEGNEQYKDLDTGFLHGQLMYAFNEQDEVAPAQDLAAFAKTQTQIEFVGALTNDGNFLDAEDVKVLAALPNKQQLRGMAVAAIAAPVSGLVNTIAGNVRGILNVLNARADSLGQ
jgi:large subunit ribosomal protein L10